MSKKGIRFRIGVTGHRDILPEDYETASQSSTRFLSQLQATMPDTGITVISGLADGADRIFAKAALALDMDVEAVLPMPLKFYKSDFDKKSYDELENLIETENVSCIELPLGTGMNDNESSWSAEKRNALYANLSDDLHNRSNVLVTFWDGEFNKLTGGTADTLMRYLGTATDINNVAEIIDAGDAALDGQQVAYWIPVRRASSDDSSTAKTEKQKPCWLAMTGEKLQQWPDMPDDFSQELMEFNHFNKQHAELSQSDALISYGNLLSSDSEIIEENSRYYQETDRAYVMADSLALYFQTRSDKLFKLFGMMAALMGLLFLVYAKLAAVQILLIGYLALFFVGVYLNIKGGKNQWFTRHLVYRSLAETLRVRFYLDLSGARERVDIQDLLQIAGINNFSGFSWIRHVLQSTNPVKAISKIESDKASQHIDTVRQLWIEDQSGYFERKTHQLNHHHHKLEKVKSWIIGGLVVAAITLVFFKKVLLGFEITETLSLKTLLIFAMGLFPFLLGVWEIYQNKMAIKELMWQYFNQSRSFSSANQLLLQSSNVEFQKDAIAQLGKTSILENFLWIIQRYHREHESPTAG